MNSTKSEYKYKLFFVFVFVITIIRLCWNFLYGFRWPSAYVLSNSVFTYDNGFIPRSLIASSLKVFFGNRIYDMKFLYIVIVGTGLLILFFYCYLSYFFAIKTHNIVGSVIILWYSLSIYSAYIAHEMGYFEQYGYLFICGIILLCSALKSDIKFSIVCAVLMFLSLLISETNAFLVCPVLLSMSFLKSFEEISVKDSWGGGWLLSPSPSPRARQK